MKKEKVFWGLLLLLGGVFLVISKLGYLSNVNAASIAISVILVGIMIRSIVKANFGGILFPLAFLAIIYDEQLGITAITPWTVLIAALLGTIGLSMIFSKHKWDFCNKHKVVYSKRNESDCDESNKVKIDNTFVSSVKYINSESFEEADIDCSFGSLKLYFDNCIMKGEKAVLDLDISFSSAEIYIPKGWKIDNQAIVSFGGIKEKNVNNSDVITNTLVLTGEVSFSGVDIIYI